MFAHSADNILEFAFSDDVLTATYVHIALVVLKSYREKVQRFIGVITLLTLNNIIMSLQIAARFSKGARSSRWMRARVRRSFRPRVVRRGDVDLSLCEAVLRVIDRAHASVVIARIAVHLHLSKHPSSPKPTLQGILSVRNNAGWGPK